jgi:hypothetical protein
MRAQSLFVVLALGLALAGRASAREAVRVQSFMPEQHGYYTIDFAGGHDWERLAATTHLLTTTGSRHFERAEPRAFDAIYRVRLRCGPGCAGKPMATLAKEAADHVNSQRRGARLIRLWRARPVPPPY